MRLQRLLCGLAFAAVGIGFAPALGAAPPTVPAALPYQGLLLDGLGQPRTGSVDLVARIWDSIVGGVLVYKQSFPTVPLSDGVFTVQLGPAGEGSDAPDDPLTTDLATALAGDSGPAAPTRFLEVTVGADGPLARTQILASAYALRASSAAAADTAATATTANDVVSVGGVDAAFVTQVFQHFAFDGGDPPNDDPREGLADLDGDGLANFVDPDNDGDEISDQAELDAGFDLNLVTPRLTSVSPGSGYFDTTTNVTVQGKFFEPGMSVAFGTQTPTPANLTGTSFDVTVGPQLTGPVNVSVTLPNGQSRSLTNAFRFDESIAHTISLLAPGIPIDVRDGTLEVILGGAQQYGAGLHAQQEFPLTSRNDGAIGVAFAPSGAVAGVRCRDLSTSCAVELLVDTDADDALEDETPVVVDSINGSNAKLLSVTLDSDAAGHWAVGYERFEFTAAAAVAHDRNGDGDFADGNERVIVESSLSSFAFPVAAKLAIDSTSRLAFVYPNPNAVSVRVAWDRSGDGDFADVVGANPELSTLASGAITCLGAAFDASDRLAVAYGQSGAMRFARDLNADGDFADPNEVSVIEAVTANGCDVASRPGQALALVYSVSANPPRTSIRIDANEDGDFDDPGESTTLGVASSPLGIALNGLDRLVIGTTGFLRFAPAN